jgi:cytoskeletal protein CcmA (bactofilin family)
MKNQEPPATGPLPSTNQPESAPPVQERRRVAWVGQSVVFKGELISSEDMRIDGRVEGTVTLGNHDLIVGPHGNVNAAVVARTITVRGTVKGALTAAERIEIRETATIEGEVTAPRLAIMDGAAMKCRVNTGQKRTAIREVPPQLANAV